MSSEVELQQIGNYTITGLLRVSSTHITYTGRQRKKDVVIKKFSLPIASLEDKKAFLTRIKQLKKLNDRAIIAILDAQFDGDYPYLIQEAFTGPNLLERTQPDACMKPDIVKSYLTPIANALQYAHMNKIVHANLQPGNFYLDKKHTPQLTGFSLTPPGFNPSLDETELAIPYMAPEQLAGHPTSASDQYSLAVITYEWLCGQRPYATTDRDKLIELQQEAVPRLRSFNKAISASTEKVIRQALSFNPTERFPHIQAFATAYLHALMGIPITFPTAATPHIVVPLQTTVVATSEETESDHTEKSGEIPAKPQAEKEGTKTEKRSSVREPAAKNVSSIPTTPDKETEKVPVTLTEADTLHPTTNQDDTKNRRERLLHMTDTTHKEQPVTPAESETSKSGLFDDLVIENSPRLLHIVSEDLRQGGVLSSSLPGYEERPVQVEMATLVAKAITQQTPAIIEAATGTGKSLAYLIPTVRSGHVAIISTANKALQEQLFYKDIPFVQQHIKHFEAALVKGVNNYICLERVENERIGLQMFAKNRDFQRLYEYLNDPETAIDFTGDFETLTMHLPADIRGRIATDSDQCAWSKCSFFDDCYVRAMRERAERAQIIVVNHTLLLLDAAMGGFLLPERDLIILDEAHHLEEEATRSFTITIHPNQIQTLLAQRMLKDHSLLSLQDDAMRFAQVLWMKLEGYSNPGHKGRINLERPVEEGLRLATAISDLTDSMRRQRPKDLPDKESQIYEKLLKRAQNLSEHIRTVFSVADPNKFVYYVERAESNNTRGFLLQASAAPLDVTSWLKERLFNKSNIISTSATLATVGPNPANPNDKGPNFAYFRKRVGLDTTETSDIIEHILPLTFDYEQNALLYIPRHLPAPTFGTGSEDYMKDIAREMYRLVKYSRGRAFLLFSSKRMLDRAYELMEPHLPYPLLKQGDMTRMELTRRFREEEGSVLFGLKSFWEGVDIAGDALSLVVIDKLPFDPPDDPVHEARVAQMKAAGENWFGTYVLPQTVLRLKQGIGRLLRTRQDRGVMAILDTRLHTKSYGRQVLNALPPARHSSNIRDVEDFFATTE